MRTHVSASVRLAVMAVLLCAGCAAQSLPMRYPSQPQAGMTREQLDKDERACVDVAAQARAERAWAYIGCMISRGHSTAVGFQVQMAPTLMAVTQTKPHEPIVAAAEVEGCRKAGYAAGRAQGGSRDAIVNQMETAFRECLAPLGYTVRRQPPPAAARR